MTKHAPRRTTPEEPTPNDASSGTEKTESAMKPLLWLLIPFVALMLYGIFGG